MKRETRIILMIVILALALLLKVYTPIDTKLQGFLIESETAYIDRIIDGDTVKSNGTSIRLLGINTPERGEKYYSEAKEFMTNLVINQTVNLEFGKEKEDRYQRTLAYLSLDGENINQKMVEEGYANIYFPSGKDVHYKEFMDSWEKCIEENKNLCEKSEDKCADCIILKEFDYKKDSVILQNNCGFECDMTGWTIKDEGRKKFEFQNLILGNSEEINITAKDFGEEYVWTDTGDTLFLRDDEDKLVLWKSY